MTPRHSHHQLQAFSRTRFLTILAALVMATGLLLSAPAHADVAPTDAAAVSTPAPDQPAAKADEAPRNPWVLPLAVVGALFVPAAVLGLMVGLGAAGTGAAGTIITPRWSDGAPRPFEGEPVELAQVRIWAAFGLLVAGPVVLVGALTAGAVGTGLLATSAVLKFQRARAETHEVAVAPHAMPAQDTAQLRPATPPTEPAAPVAPAPAPVEPPPPPPVVDLDADHDGVEVPADRCGDVAGPVENQGCPWPDTDHDGVTDNVDGCVAEAGPVDNRGCPWGDVDHDGLADNIDRCPQEAGPAESGGCPKLGAPTTQALPEIDPRCMVPENLAVVIKEDQVLIPTKIQFRPGTATILGASTGLLDQIALTLKCRVDIKQLRVDGHTDATGSDTLNTRLSLARANAVREHLVSHGKVARNRLVTSGNGSARPIATNDNEEGREKNRRVEFVIVEMSK